MDLPEAAKRLVLSPQEPLVGGGPAEEYERRVQELLASGCRHLVVDLSGVADIDNVGIRALVRGHTSAQRLRCVFRLAALTPKVREILLQSHLDSVFEIFDSVEAAEARRLPWQTVAVVAGGAALFVALIAASVYWSRFLVAPEVSPTLGVGETPQKYHTSEVHPLVEFLKLVLAAVIGIFVTAIHKSTRGDKPMTRSLEQAHVLLCVAGALMMILIGNSLPRAFGLAGAASIIRFRTPVEDPRDTTTLFLLIGLGMATGMGAFAVAALGTTFLCVFLLVLDRIAKERQRTMLVQLQSESREFPVAHVQSVFARYRITFEPREISQGEKAGVNYLVKLDPQTSIEELSTQLMNAPAGLKSVNWKMPKKDEI